MPFVTQLLRILLIVALVAPGPGMAVPQLAVSMASSHAVAANGGCHEHARIAHAASVKNDDMRGHAQHPARCSSTDCHCACSHLLPALTGVFAQEPVVARALSIPPLAQRHPDAALAHLIRPPIG